MEIKSRKVTSNNVAAQMCDFLSDVKNYEKLMPENISKFKLIRDDAFVFALKGMPEIALEVKEIIRPNKVELGAISDKIPFQLTSLIKEIDSETSEIELKFAGDFNPMMAMMIKGPITKFLESLISNIESL